MKNKDVVDAFFSRKRANTVNLHTDGDRLFSYHTCVAQWLRGYLIVNTTRYSVSTSRHRNYVVSRLGSWTLIPTSNNVPQETSDLNSYVEWYKYI